MLVAPHASPPPPQAPPEPPEPEEFDEDAQDSLVLLMALTEKRRARIHPPPCKVEATTAVVLPKFLDEAEVSEVYAAAKAFQHERAEGESTFSRSHRCFNLHSDGWFAAIYPELSAKIVEGMRSNAPDKWSQYFEEGELRTRCVEFHTYVPGGGLMEVAHRDFGSTLTMSILLSAAAEMGGGHFITWKSSRRDRMPVVHDAMVRGDALLFASEKIHNVSPITRGVRNSLVIELWTGAANAKNRFT